MDVLELAFISVLSGLVQPLASRVFNLRFFSRLVACNAVNTVNGLLLRVRRKTHAQLGAGAESVWKRPSLPQSRWAVLGFPQASHLLYLLYKSEDAHAETWGSLSSSE